MRMTIFGLGLLAAVMPATAAVAAPAPMTIESYYRIKWGSAGEFKRLYKANHQPLLDEMKRQGRILAIRTDEPFTHIAGGQRWDLRVTITYNSAPDGVEVGGAFDEAWEKAKARLYPDQAKLDADEARRFGLLDEHWDVIVVPSKD